MAGLAPADYDNRTEKVTLACGGTYSLDRDYDAWADYRSRPFPACKRTPCQRKVEA